VSNCCIKRSRELTQQEQAYYSGITTGSFQATRVSSRKAREAATTCSNGGQTQEKAVG